jgi:hypothetical protein
MNDTSKDQEKSYIDDKNEHDEKSEIYDKLEQFASGPVTIPSPYAKKWYDIGFIFAVNYVYAKLAESTDTGFTQAKFRDFCRGRFGEDLIDERYFESRPFHDDSYPSGQCPGDIPNTCIPCTARNIARFRRNPR